MNSKKYVFHKEYGIGEIVRKRFGGLKVLVKFENGYEVWVNFNKIKYIDKEKDELINENNLSAIIDYVNSKIKDEESESKTEENQFVANSKTETFPKEKTNRKKYFMDRSIVESLRLGIVPHSYVSEFTVGRKREFEKIKEYLKEDKVIILEGEYGAGKTHFLEYLSYQLVREGWGVAYINIDSQEVRLNDPRSVYSGIIKTFRFREEKGGFKDFFEETAKHYGKLKGHLYLHSILSQFEENKDIEEFWEYVSARVPKYNNALPPFPSEATSSSIYIYIINGIAWALKNVLSKKGLVLLFDEAESLDESFYSYYRKMRDKDFIKGLEMVIENNNALLRERILQDPINGSGRYGEKTKLKYYGRDIKIYEDGHFSRYELHYAWKIPSYVKAVFAFTPESRAATEIFEKQNVIRLKQLEENDMYKIFHKLKNFYENAYSYEIEKTDIEKFLTEFGQSLYHPRKLMKRIIETFDLERLIQ